MSLIAERLTTSQNPAGVRKKFKASDAGLLSGKEIKKAAYGRASRKKPSYENDHNHEPIASGAGSRYISEKTNRPCGVPGGRSGYC